MSTPPCRSRSSIRRPTGLSARAVTTAVRSPKQRRSPRATLYSPPPSQTVEITGGGDADVAGVQAQHDLAGGDEVPAALRGRAGDGMRPQPWRRAAATAPTASAVRSRIRPKSPAASRSLATIQLPPHAATCGRLR